MKLLSSQERVNRALERRDHDHIPRSDSFWHETIARWAKEEGFTDAMSTAYDALENDFGFLAWYWPTPFGGRDETVAEDAETRTYIDENGATVKYWKNKSGTPEHIGWECTTPEIWRQRFRHKFVEGHHPWIVEGALKNFANCSAKKQWSYLAGVEPFEVLRKLLGDVTSLMAMIEEPEWIKDIAEVSTDCTLRTYQLILDAGVRPDGLWTYGDMAYNHSTMCSPATYKELIWPSHKRLCDWAHANGMKFIYHTDGDVNGVMDLYVKAGFDAYQPIESKANMDIRKLAPRYGKDLTFFGNIDVMKMITNDLDIMEEEIASKFAAGMANKGYIYHSDHSVPPQVSWKTYRGIIDLVNRYGNYQ